MAELKSGVLIGDKVYVSDDLVNWKEGTLVGESEEVLFPYIVKIKQTGEVENFMHMSPF